MQQSGGTELSNDVWRVVISDEYNVGTTSLLLACDVLVTL